MLKAAVVGGSGYVGGELVRLLLGHPHVELVAVTGNDSSGKPLGEVHPNLHGVDMEIAPLAEVGDADVLFCALPNGETMKVIGRLPDRRIVDTSADFRLRDAKEYARYYRSEHPAMDRVAKFSYGLPELFRSRLKEAGHIAAPGCFATAVILSLYPLVAEGLATTVVVNAVTGSSGSGVKPKERAHHPFRADSYFAYEPFTHRHVPEIRQALRDATGRDVSFLFQPHSGPFARGIFATTAAGLSSITAGAEVPVAFQRHYGREPFVRLVSGSPNVKWVRGTNFCDIGVATDGSTAVVTAAIDNLMKGAASQAVQAFNVASGFDEGAGLKGFAANP